MGFRRVNDLGQKTKKAMELEELRNQIGRIRSDIQDRQKKILSRQFIRSADFISMTNEKAALEKDQREANKLERKAERLESGFVK